MHSSILIRCADVACTLLPNPREGGVLHGDLQRDGVLDVKARGLSAIDPEYLAGDCCFDFANIFTHPDLSDATHPVAIEPPRFARRAEALTAAAGLKRGRPLHWGLVRIGPAVVRFLADCDPAIIDLQTVELPPRSEIDDLGTGGQKYSFLRGNR